MSEPKPTVLVEEFEHGRCESHVISPDGVNVVKQGESKTWLRGQLVLSEWYTDDKLDGLQTKYYTSGDVYKTVEWVAGVKHGHVRVNREDGTRLEYTNVNGEVSGLAYTWDRNGALIETIEYD